MVDRVPHHPVAPSVWAIGSGCRKWTEGTEHESPLPTRVVSCFLRLLINTEKRGHLQLRVQVEEMHYTACTVRTDKMKTNKSPLKTIPLPLTVKLRQVKNIECFDVYFFEM